MTDAPRVTLQRVVEWPDTDAAGHYHHSTVLRWAEAAEAELYAARGLSDYFGVIPRVRYEVEYSTRLWFRDEVTVGLEVTRLGRSSIDYSFTVQRGDEAAARGRMTAVLVDRDTGRSVPWPDDVRRLLAPAGPDTPSANMSSS